MSETLRGLAGRTFRKKTNLAVAALTEAAAPLLRVCARISCRRGSFSPEKWRQGVLLGAAHIGDVLYTTPSMEFLKQEFPECDWHFVAPPPASDVLLNNAFIASCVPSLHSLCSRVSIDVAVCYNSAAYWRQLIGATRFGIPNRVSYTHKGFSGLVNFPISIQYPQPYPAYFRDLVGQLTNCTPNWTLRPKVYPDMNDEERAEAVWREANFESGKPVIACFVTSRQPSGVWPAAKFAESVAHIEADASFQTVLCGTGADKGILNEMKAEFGLRAHIVAGKLSVLSLSCFLRRCAAVLCPDSGPRHLANAVGTPVVFVRNIAVGKIETGAYSDTETDIVASNFECVPIAQQKACFEALDPKAVVAQIFQSVAQRNTNVTPVTR